MAPSSKKLIQFGFLTKAGSSKKKQVMSDAEGAARRWLAQATPDEKQKHRITDKDSEKKFIKKYKDKQWEKKLDSASDDELEKWADHHDVEMALNQMRRSSYPKPMQYYHVIYESFQQPLEKFYFWATNHMIDLGYGKVDKISDIFAASEQSAMYGSSAQRLGLAQDKVTGYLVSIGRLVKDLFGMIRELRVMDERLQYYREAESDNKAVRDTAEVALKSLFVELVEGGAKNTNSVYGLARELNFVTLPQLFFSQHPQKVEEIAKWVDKLEYNANVKDVLQKKLYQYLIWRKKTHQEHKDRRNHLLKYVRQHHEAIQLYLTWVKPYLKHIKRLGANQDFLDSADLVSAFEGAVIEIEVLGQQMVKGGTFKGDNIYCCLLLTFKYRTSPRMAFQGQDYKQGPLHMGKIDVEWRSYAWTQEEVDNYKRMRDVEGYEMLANIDSSIREAMQGLGDALKEYLDEASGTKAEDDLNIKAPPSSSMLDPFKGVGKVMDNMFAPIKDGMDLIKSIGAVPKKSKGPDKGAAAGRGKIMAWIHYKNFKKAHGMVAW